MSDATLDESPKDLPPIFAANTEQDKPSPERFYVATNVKDYRQVVDLIKDMGGVVTQIHEGAHHIVDPDSEIGPDVDPATKLVSSTYIFDCANSKRRIHMRGYVVNRVPGQNRTEKMFSDEERQTVLDFLSTTSLGGTPMWKDLEKKHPSHSFCAWRSYYQDQILPSLSSDEQARLSSRTAHTLLSDSEQEPSNSLSNLLETGEADGEEEKVDIGSVDDEQAPADGDRDNMDERLSSDDESSHDENNANRENVSADTQVARIFIAETANHHLLTQQSSPERNVHESSMRSTLVEKVSPPPSTPSKLLPESATRLAQSLSPSTSWTNISPRHPLRKLISVLRPQPSKPAEQILTQPPNDSESLEDEHFFETQEADPIIPESIALDSNAAEINAPQETAEKTDQHSQDHDTRDEVDADAMEADKECMQQVDLQAVRESMSRGATPVLHAPQDSMTDNLPSQNESSPQNIRNLSSTADHPSANSVPRSSPHSVTSLRDVMTEISPNRSRASLPSPLNSEDEREMHRNYRRPAQSARKLPPSLAQPESLTTSYDSPTRKRPATQQHTPASNGSTKRSRLSSYSHRSDNDRATPTRSETSRLSSMGGNSSTMSQSGKNRRHSKAIYGELLSLLSQGALKGHSRQDVEQLIEADREAAEEAKRSGLFVDGSEDEEMEPGELLNNLGTRERTQDSDDLRNAIGVNSRRGSDLTLSVMEPSDLRPMMPPAISNAQDNREGSDVQSPGADDDVFRPSPGVDRDSADDSPSEVASPEPTVGKQKDTSEQVILQRHIPSPSKVVVPPPRDGGVIDRTADTKMPLHVLRNHATDEQILEFIDYVLILSSKFKVSVKETIEALVKASCDFKLAARLLHSRTTGQTQGTECQDPNGWTSDDDEMLRTNYADKLAKTASQIEERRVFLRYLEMPIQDIR
ncbi:hypothetical protein BZG36_03453 [Bifiguratus adelaidae]|uniref:TERF2-interacting telomeric protein 1 Myb domain-containing protein n=1 Tax=Bifiguratus adelaidae TaxID=1938954 RepID=A0A261XXZ8_9FUNG|nr:hypothetical protein BZG36_03453 [Bifiguratus adelaidae]